MKKISKYLIMLLMVCSVMGGTKTLAWWNLIYDNYTIGAEKEDDAPKVKFFIWEWISSFKR